MLIFFFFFFSSRRRHTRFKCDWSSDVCSSDLLDVRPGSPLLAIVIYVMHRRAGPDIKWKWGIGWGMSVGVFVGAMVYMRSEERRVGKECRSRWSPYH